VFVNKDAADVPKIDGPKPLGTKMEGRKEGKRESRQASKKEGMKAGRKNT
jgi:hypothetical protein